MSAVVFLRAVNIGTTNRCRPAEIAKHLEKFDVVNIGAVGTFVVRRNVSESALRGAIAKQLPFKCEIMIIPARDVLKLHAKDPFAKEPSSPDIARFVNVLAKPVPKNVLAALPQTSKLKAQTFAPLFLPSERDWGVKVVAIEDRFVLGLYRREMKAISYLGKLEKLLGLPATTRNWNTIDKIVRVLLAD